MKTLILSMILATSTAFAGVKEDVESLGRLAFGWNVTSVQGRTAKAILENFAEGEELVDKEIADMEWGDETKVGFTSVQSARFMGDYAEGVLEEQVEYADGPTRARLQRQMRALSGWSPLIDKLHAQGVKFGYNGNGPGYCGVMFVQLLIIDAKAQKVYEVHLSEGGDC